MAVEQVAVPDIGDFSDIPVIEVLVQPGDTVAMDDPLVTLESDKATMDIPSPYAGTVQDLVVRVGDTVSEGMPILTLETADEAAGDAPEPDEPAPGNLASTGSTPEAVSSDAIASATTAEALDAPERAADGDAGGLERAGGGDASANGASGDGGRIPAEGGVPYGLPAEGPAPAEEDGDGDGDGGPVYASPSVRRLARERGVDLSTIHGTGRKGRITKEDVLSPQPAPAATPSAPAAAAAGGVPGLQLAPWPSVDFEKFGPVERVELTRIQRISGPNLARNWVMIPHVTHNDEADITELEAFRKQLNAEQDVKVTMVALLLKACVASLKSYPAFNSSLDGDHLVLKRYYHLGFATDTPNGLLVPVIRDVDQKGLLQVADELRDLSGRAREGKLKLDEMRGGTFSISSLGGIGGTSFTPIVNAPEVAILGVTRSAMRPVWTGSEFVPRLIVPLSLSYDHRVIDGALAARFMVHLVKVLEDMRRVLL